MRIFVLGGDGFCGWPTALHLSQHGHDVVIVDNFARRNADVELEASSLTPIVPLGTRIAAWKELTGHELGFHRLDVAQDYAELRDLLAEERPGAVVHFGYHRAVRNVTAYGSRCTNTGSPDLTARSAARPKAWRTSSADAPCGTTIS